MIRLRKVKQAHEQLTEFMKEQVEEKRREVRDGTSKRDDVFTRLVQANEDEESKFRLADDELVSLSGRQSGTDNLTTIGLDWQCLCDSVRGTRCVIFLHHIE
jgi:hypothetical protein